MIRIAFERYRDLGLLILRLGFGLGFFWFHGLPKLQGGPEAWEGAGGAMSQFGITFAPEWWGFAAAVAEGVGGLLIAAGLFFRPAVLAVFFVMVVAATNHFVTGRGTPAHAFKNAWVLAGLFLIGPGRYSIDHLLARRRTGRDGAAAEAADAASPAGSGASPAAERSADRGSDPSGSDPSGTDRSGMDG